MKKLCKGQTIVAIYGVIISSITINTKSWKKVTNSDLDLKNRRIRQRGPGGRRTDADLEEKG